MPFDLSATEAKVEFSGIIIELISELTIHKEKVLKKTKNKDAKIDNITKNEYG